MSTKIRRIVAREQQPILLAVAAMFDLRGIIIIVLTLLSLEFIPYPRSLMPPKKASAQKRKLTTEVVDFALAGFASVVGASFELTEESGSRTLINATCYDTSGGKVLVNGPDKRPRVALRMSGDYSAAFESGQLNEAGKIVIVAKLQEKLATSQETTATAGTATTEPAVANVPSVVESPLLCSICSGEYREGFHVHENCTGRICTECFASQVEQFLSTDPGKDFECPFENCETPLSSQTILDCLEATASVVSATLQSR
jgi:hypothetical protein